MDDGPYWVILLMYGSHDMRHIGFRRLTLVNETPGFWGVTLMLYLYIVPCLRILLLTVVRRWIRRGKKVHVNGG